MKRRAIFLDRDGTINYDPGYLKDAKELRLLPHAGSAIGEMNRLNFIVVVATNQAAIARGYLTEAGLKIIHQTLTERLKKKKAKIDAIYYCPHHPESHREKYRVNCGCRKPRIGMLKKAARDLDIDLKRSFLIGDSTRDMLAGKRAGLTTILVKTGNGGKDGKHNVKPDHIAQNLKDAVLVIKTRRETRLG